MKFITRQSSVGAESSAVKSAGVAILGGTIVSLTLLEKIMDALSIPVVKGSAAAVLEVIKLLQSMHNNKVDCAELLQCSTSLMVVILGSFDGKRENEIPDHLRRAVERLTMIFHEVMRELKKVDRRGSRHVVGILYTNDNAVKLKGCSAKLNWAMQEFQVTSKVDSCLKDLERHEEIKKGLSDTVEAVEKSRLEILQAIAKVQMSSTNTNTNLPTCVMPAEPVVFGRDGFIEQAIDLILNNTSARIAILGPGGIGKTSAALKIIHDRRIRARFGKNCRWVPCDQATSIPLLHELIASSLDLPSSNSNDRFKEIVNSLESSRERVILLFDNLETPWDIDGEHSKVAEILIRLGSIPSVSFIITMRSSHYPVPDLVNWCQPLLPPLTPLELTAGRDAFLRVAPNSVADPQLDPLLRELDCVPLAITLMARLAVCGESPTDLVSQWKEERTALLDQVGGDRGTSIEVSIKLSIHSNAMKHCPDALALLSVLAKLPAGSPVNHLPAICPFITGWRKALRVLKSAALIYENADKSFIHMLSSIRQYVLLHHPLEAKELHDLQSAYFDFASKGSSQPGDQDFLMNRQELARIEANMETLLVEALHEMRTDKDAAIAASVNYTRYLHWTQPRADIIKAAAQVAQESKSKLLADCQWQYSRILNKLNQYDLAQTELQKARSEYTARGNRLGAGRCLQLLANILQMKNRYEEAEALFQKAESEFKSIGNRLGAAQCRHSLGDIHWMRNQYKEAEVLLEQARSEFDDLGNHLGTAQCLQSLGEILRMQDRDEEAEMKLKQAKLAFEAIGDHNCATQCLQSLGDLRRMQNQYEEAEILLKQAKADFEAIENHLSAAQCLRSLGEILRMLDQHREAEVVLNQAKSKFDNLGNCLGSAQCLHSLGVMLQEQGQYDQAQLVLEQAKSVLISINAPLDMAYCLESLGTALQLQDNYAAALNELKQARAIFLSLDEMSWVEHCDQEISLIHNLITMN